MLVVLEYLQEVLQYTFSLTGEGPFNWSINNANTFFIPVSGAEVGVQKGATVSPASGSLMNGSNIILKFTLVASIKFKDYY